MRNKLAFYLITGKFANILTSRTGDHGCFDFVYTLKGSPPGEGGLSFSVCRDFAVGLEAFRGLSMRDFCPAIKKPYEYIHFFMRFYLFLA